MLQAMKKRARNPLHGNTFWFNKINKYFGVVKSKDAYIKLM
jgi:hypothetical protein